MTSETIDIGGSIELVDVVGDGQGCERWLWIRGLSDPTLAPKARIDLVDDLKRYPGELLYVASREGTMAATAFTIVDEAGFGACYLTVHARTDPGEPVVFALEESPFTHDERMAIRGFRA